MRIVFDGTATGFGNNGGTLTVFKSAEALAGLGYKVFCLSESNKFTWFKLKKAVYITSRPKADVTIATGHASVPHVLKVPGKKVWWIRGWETWGCPEERWTKYLKEFPNIITNSEGLSSRVSLSVSRMAPVFYPGVDTKDFYMEGPMSSRNGVGFLNSPSKPTKNMGLVNAICNKSQADTYMYGFGPKPDWFRGVYIQNPSIRDKRKLYNRCAVWVATSISEGLHIPPLEAALCGCILICIDHPYNGTSDYYGTAVIVVRENNTQKFVDVISDVSALSSDERMAASSATAGYITNKIGTRDTCMKKLVRYLREDVK